MFRGKEVKTSREQPQNGILQSGPVDLVGSHIVNDEIVLMTMPQGNQARLAEVRIKGVDADLFAVLAIGATEIEPVWCPANSSETIVFTVPPQHDPSVIGGEDVKLVIKQIATITRGYASARGWLM